MVGELLILWLGQRPKSYIFGEVLHLRNEGGVTQQDWSGRVGDSLNIPFASPHFSVSL
jgi:hypothetical protein